MPALLVFNELSVEGTLPEMGTASARLAEFASVLTDSRIKGGKQLITPANFLRLEIARGYSFGRWISQEQWENRDRRVVVKTLLEKRLDYDKFLSQEVGSELEYTRGNSVARAAHIADAQNGLVVSVATREEWDTPTFAVERTSISGQEPETYPVEVIHASRPVHLDEHGDWLRGTEIQPARNGRDLWSRRAELFGNVDFCTSVEAQLTAMTGTQPQFLSARRGIGDLQYYCERWNTGNFDVNRLSRASGESLSTLQRYSAERTFLCPDGVRRVFEFHLKRHHQRIHFIPIPESKRILVGYVGPHLPISSE
jgi:hypothetical protein